MNEQGFIVLYRQLLEWKYFYSPYALKLWVYLLLRANWKTGYFLGVEIPRGSLATSIRRLASDTDMDANTVRKWLKRFEKEDMISIKTTHRFTHIFISNYADFQDIVVEQVHTESHTEPHTQSHTESHTVRPPNRTRITKKQSNKETIKDSLGAGSSEKNNFPDLKDVAAQVSKESLGVNPEKFFRYYEERNWMIDGEPVRDWKKLLRSWARKEIKEMLSVKIDLPEHFTNNSQSMERGPIDYSTMPGGEEDDLE